MSPGERRTRWLRMLRNTTCALLALVLPTAVARLVLNILGHKIYSGTKIGISWVFSDLIALDKGVRIGHLNLLAVRRLVLRSDARIGRANILKGPISVLLGPHAAIGNENRIVRARPGVSAGSAQLWLGEGAKITSSHRVDCTQSVRFGKFSFLAGVGSQVWTHGYVHDTSGPGRYRVDGRVTIEDNVYIGSACFVSMGVRIAQGAVVGGGTAVAQSLREPGLYVSAAIRVLPRPTAPELRADLKRLTNSELCETVFIKRHP
jgi:acetyltransferase-like isoleucine patch superfamily enzyme